MLFPSTALGIVPLDKLLAFKLVRYVPVPTWLADILPTVAALSVAAIIVPVTLAAANVGLAVDRKSWGVFRVIVEPLAVAVNPLLPAKVNVPPPAMDPVPDVPAKLKPDDATDAVPNATTRPWASVVITGINDELPTVVAPGPVVGKLTVTAPVDADTVKLPVPLELNPVTPVLVIVNVSDGPVSAVLLNPMAVPAVKLRDVIGLLPLSNNDPAYSAPVIPTPPATRNAPVDVEVAAVPCDN